jgi:hypothetical protein
MAELDKKDPVSLTELMVSTPDEFMAFFVPN